MREYRNDPGLAVVSARYIGEVGVTATMRMNYTGISGKLLGLLTHYRELVQRLANVLIESGIAMPDVAGLLARTELCKTLGPARKPDGVPGCVAHHAELSGYRACFPRIDANPPRREIGS
jgi:hypothetical protein